MSTFTVSQVLKFVSGHPGCKVADMSKEWSANEYEPLISMIVHYLINRGQILSKKQQLTTTGTGGDRESSGASVTRYLNTFTPPDFAYCTLASVAVHPSRAVPNRVKFVRVFDLVVPISGLFLETEGSSISQPLPWPDGNFMLAIDFHGYVEGEQVPLNQRRFTIYKPNSSGMGQIFATYEVHPNAWLSFINGPSE
jgi:hypothetical protein